MDDADIAILRAVQDDARHSMRALAKLAGVSTPTASAKLRALESKGVLQGHGARLSPEALGQHVLFLEFHVRPSDLEAVSAALTALPEVRVCHILSPHRVFAFATLIDPAVEAEFHGKLSRIGEIQSYESFLLLKTVKDLPLAQIDRGIHVAIRCEFCGRRSKDEVVRVKVGDLTHFVCCQACKAGFEERADRLGKMAGRAGATGARRQREAVRPRGEHEGHRHV